MVWCVCGVCVVPTDRPFCSSCVCVGGVAVGVCVCVWCLYTGPLAVPESEYIPASAPCAAPSPRTLNLPDPHLVHAVTLSGFPFQCYLLRGHLTYSN